jgi:ABC-type cobalamin/Fe3+-siderophores transport system ATPase subunit
MHLKSFQVRVFRNVIDSGPIEVERNTCLVGKNEAGKTAVIEALHRLNPAKPTPLVLLDEYPRWLKKQHEISGAITSAVPITATYELSDEECSELESAFGTGVLKTKEVTVHRKYGEEMTVMPSINHTAFLKQFTESHVPDMLREKLKSVSSSSELMKAVDAIIAGKTTGNEPTPEAQAAKPVKAELAKLFGASSHLTAAITARVTALVPKTFYFSSYSQLRGRYSMAEVLPALTTDSQDDEVRAAADFLRLARIDAANLQTQEFEQSNAELEAISSLLTQRVRANWKQNKHLKLSVKIEPSGNAAKPHERFLQFRVEDMRHDFSSRLDRRSTGFRWFVSFMASFFEFEQDTNLILLLDEPGLSLHARAQMDLLDAIETHLTRNRQVLYTTHSPFMVRTESLARVRIVEDRGPESGSVVSNNAGASSDPDTLFPLQAALGYDIAQNLFIGNRNILLEGTSDFIYLSAFSSFFSAAGGSSFPGDSRLLPAGGATNIPTFIALLGGQLDIVVLLDGNAQRQKIDNAIAQGRLSAQRVLSIDQFVPVKGADIEDLFEPGEYLSLYNAATNSTITVKQLKGNDRIVQRIRRAQGHDFDHGLVAAYFLKHQATILPTLKPDTLARFDSVIHALSNALPVAPQPAEVPRKRK